MIKEGGQYHLFVLAMDASSPHCANHNDPNAGGCFDMTGRIDRAVSASPLGPFACVEEDVLGRRGGNPQVFRAHDGTLLLAAEPISQVSAKNNICNVWSSASGTVRGPWQCYNNATNRGFNNPSLAQAAAAKGGREALHVFYHAPKCYGSAVYGASALSPRGPWATHAISNASRRMEYGLDQLFVHPCEGTGTCMPSHPGICIRDGHDGRDLFSPSVVPGALCVQILLRGGMQRRSGSGCSHIPSEWA